jgi:hypothetical protein
MSGSREFSITLYFRITLGEICERQGEIYFHLQLWFEMNSFDIRVERAIILSAVNTL